MASCVSNVADYEIAYSTGSVYVTVSCSGGKQVLGCGVIAGKGPINKYEAFQAYYVSESNTCTCYNYFGVTCFAVCGQLL